MGDNNNHNKDNKYDEMIVHDCDDPRFNLHIEDLSEYNKTIYPLHLYKGTTRINLCTNNDGIKRKYYDCAKYERPMLRGCWNERYENCIIPEKNRVKLKYYRTIDDTIDYDDVNLTNNINTVSDTDNKTLNIADLKKQCKSHIYSSQIIPGCKRMSVSNSSKECEQCKKPNEGDKNKKTVEGFDINWSNVSSFMFIIFVILSGIVVLYNAYLILVPPSRGYYPPSYPVAQ